MLAGGVPKAAQCCLVMVDAPCKHGRQCFDAAVIVMILMVIFMANPRYEHGGDVFVDIVVASDCSDGERDGVDEGNHGRDRDCHGGAIAGELFAFMFGSNKSTQQTW